MKNKPILLLLPFLLACGVVPLTPVHVVYETQTPTVTVTATNTFQATSTPETVLCVSASKSLNLRIAPSTMAAADPDGLQHGDRVAVIGTGGSWYKVEVDGRSGWVHGDYLEECE